MGICAAELRDFVVKPTLKHLNQYSRAAENLLLGTAAQESGLGSHLKNGRCHGLGIYQITPQRHTKLWDQYLVNKPEMASMVRGLASQHEFLEHPHAELATNLSYSTAIAWLIYCQKDITLPKNKDDVRALGTLWHSAFHSRPHDGVEKFIQNYNRHIKPSPMAA